MTVLRRVVGVLLVVLGLASIAVAIASATVWRPSDVVTARASATDVAMITTAPGVLDLVGEEVTLTARAPGGAPVALVLGDERDVSGWIGSDPAVEVTGLASWTTLATQERAPGDGEPTTGEDGLPDPTTSDMWLASARGDGTASLTWDAPAGRVLALAVVPGADGASPELELSWPREVETPLLVPGIAVGAILVALGALLLVRAALRARREATGTTGASPVPVPAEPGAVSSAPGPEAAPGTDQGPPSSAPAPTPATTVTAAARSAMTRRELRELAEREAAEREAAEKAARAAERRARPRTGMLPAVRRAPATGQTPQVPEPQETATPPEPEQQPTPDATRADAWRQAWGFGQASWTPSAPSGGPDSTDRASTADATTTDDASTSHDAGADDPTVPPTTTGGAR